MADSEAVKDLGMNKGEDACPTCGGTGKLYDRGVQKIKNIFNEDTPSYHQHVQGKRAGEISDAVPRK